MANTTIDRIQIEVEATAKGTSAVFSQLESQLTTLKSVLNSLDTSKLSQVSNATKKVSVDTSGMTKAEKDVSNSIDKIKQSLAGLNSYKEAALSGDSSSLTSFNRRVISIQSQIDVLAEKLQQLGDNRTGINIDTDSLQTYREQLAEVQSSLSDTSSSVQTAVAEMNSAQPSIDTSEVSSGLSDVADRAKEAASSLWDMVKSGIKTGFSSLKSSLSKIKDTLTSIGTKASNTASTGFSKILKYGFGIRSLYVLFRRLRTAVKDSFTELQNSGAYYETTAANVTALKNALTTLKYQFGAAFEPIFNYVAPALQTLVNYLVTVMNTISAFIAKLTGQSTYSKAVVATSEIASNTGSAADSASDLNKQLQGFDELNNLSGDSGSSGGSGSGSSDSSSVTYVEESVDSALSSFWDTLADAISSGDWYEVGTIISDALTEAMENIPWDDIFEAAADFGTNLADFLNGLITDDLFYQLGRTIANAIKTALIAAISFGNEFDWSGLGSAIASGINGFVEQNPLELLVEAFNVWANGILTTLITAVKKVEWKTIAQQIADSIGDIDASGIMWKLGTLVSSLANALYTLVSNKDTWTNLGTKIGEGISSFFESMNETDSSTGLTGWQALGKTISNTISGIITTIKTALQKISWSDVGQAIIDLIQSVEWGKLTWDLVKLALQVAAALVDAIKGMWENATVLGKIGMAIVGLIAVSKLTGLSSTLSSMILGQVPSTLSSSTTLSVGVKFALLAGAGVAGWTLGKSFSRWIANQLSGTQGISAEAAEDYIEVSQKMTLSMIVEEVTAAASETTSSGQNRLWEAWQNMVNDWYQPIYDYIDSEQEKNKNKTGKKDSNGLELEEGTDWNDYSHNSNITKNGLTSDKTFKWDVDLHTKLTGEAKSKTDLTNLTDSLNNLSDAASKGGSASYDAKTGGDLTSIFDLDTWKTKFRNLYNQWVGKSVKMGVSAGGQFESINDVYEWVNKIDYLNQNWNGSDTSFDVNSNISDADGSGGYLERLNALKEEWKKGSASAEFKTSLTGSVTTAGGIDTLANSFKTLSTNYPSGAHSSSWNTSITGKSASDINTYAQAAKNLYNGFYTGSYNASYSVKLSGDTSGIDTLINTIKDKLNAKLGTYKLKFTNAAIGGIISGGSIKRIPQYAGGTLNAGSVFVAGESGPEIMGHINGRTEILNRSQIASIIHSSFMGAMSQFGNRMLASPESMAVRTNGYSSYMGGASNSNSDMIDIMREQNELLRENNMYQQQIARKEFSISGRDVFNSMRSESNNYYNRTGNSPFLF